MNEATLDVLRHELATTARQLIKSLGERVPDHWSDRDVLCFLTTLNKRSES